MKDRLLWYMKKGWSLTRGNVGDIISPHLVERLSGAFPEYDKEGVGRFVVVGSLLERLRDGDRVWGTGLISNDPVEPKQNVTFYAVRGPLTRKVLLRSGYGREQVPAVFGDPCVLTGYLFPRPRTLRHRIGVIPHYIDYEAFQAVFSGTAAHYINIMNSVDAFLDEINSCEVILSSSLHGIIISESYGINAIPIRFGDKLIGGSFKFDDYYLSTGRKQRRIHLSKPVTNESLEALIAGHRFVSPNIDRTALLRACPFYHTGALG